MDYLSPFRCSDHPGCQIRPPVVGAGSRWVLLVYRWPRGYPGRPGSCRQYPGLHYRAGCPLPGCCAYQGLGFGDIRVFECVAYVPATAVINKTAKNAINLPRGNALIKMYVHNLLLGSSYMA